MGNYTDKTNLTTALKKIKAWAEGKFLTASDISNKVNKEDGKGLSTNDYTTAEKTKLSGIAAGAEVNVQSDWNQTTTTADDYIKNKPTSKAAASGGTDVSLVTTGEKYTWNNKGTYSKPSGGIPKSDLASAVQTSLGLADTAVQSLDSCEKTANRSTSVTSASTNTQYPTSKAVYDAISTAISGVTQFDYEVVTSLPATGIKGKVYLIADTSGSHTEYIWIGNKYEKLGSVDVDVKDEINLFTSSSTRAQVEAGISSGKPCFYIHSNGRVYSYFGTADDGNDHDNYVFTTGEGTKIYTAINMYNGSWSTVGYTQLATVSHTHGNITNAGAITATGVALASGDSLAIVDSSDSSKIKKTSITFDGSTTTKALTQKGTWETVLNSVSDASSTVKGITTVGASGGAAAYSHSHDYTKDGSLTDDDIKNAFIDAQMFTSATYPTT